MSNVITPEAGSTGSRALALEARVPSGEGWFTRLKQDVREMLHEQVEYWDLLLTITRRDLLLRYKQTIMGVGWALLMPVMNTLIFWVIFTKAGRMDTDDIPYPLYAFSGLLVWNFLASSLKFSVTSLTSNTQLVTKVYFPRELFPFSAVAVCLVDFVVAAVVLVGMMIFYDVSGRFAIDVTSAMAFLPIVMLVHLIFTLGVSLIVAMANLFYRDVKYLFEIVLTLWMFATSVVYPAHKIEGTLGKVLSLNPMTPIVEAYREILLRGNLPTNEMFWYSATFSIITLFVGWLYFHRMEFTFAERV
jgi:lipopolysaccharide transport system permease protein